MVVDTSAIMAILMGEPDREDMLRRIDRSEVSRMSAAATLELTIVVSGKKTSDLLARIDPLLERLRVRIEPVTLEQGRLARAAFLAYGKGRHKAQLNFGDTFSYALAKAMSEPLLFKGNDFSQTDIKPAA